MEMHAEKVGSYVVGLSRVMRTGNMSQGFGTGFTGLLRIFKEEYWRRQPVGVKPAMYRYYFEIERS